MTMEIDALHAGQPMRNGLDPCNTCAEWQVLKHQRDDLRAALVKLLETHEREAKATMSYQNASENFSDSSDERKAHERAMLAASNAEREARVLLLLTLRDKP